ncbi:PREDICTED: peroxidasin-like [Branchiostoma belcheri]|uniref:Peroxidasin-like n=1 Tax=Branchiostoma belcheri TaxID=7741 RepID=A0A6P5AJK5_BRABE|nr:PREDICTED: peroxidasin-like [Branchiostoma belcheri]
MSVDPPTCEAMRLCILLVLTGWYSLFGEVTCAALIPTEQSSEQQPSEEFILSEDDWGEDSRTHEQRYPGDVFVASSLQETIRQVDSSITNTEKLHHDEDRIRTPFEFLERLHHMSPEARKEARAAAIVEGTMQLVLERVREHNKDWVAAGDMCDIRKAISPAQRDIIADMSGCEQLAVAANCSIYKYRTADGSCNNIDNPHWGAALRPFKRFMLPKYDDGWNEPIGWEKSEYNGFPLPSPRQVSSVLLTSSETEDDPEYTHMLTEWGRFLRHDMEQTATAVGCTVLASKKKILCTDTCDNVSPCFPIAVPDDDPRINNTQKPCLPFTRSSSMCGVAVGDTSNPDDLLDREQINQVSSFIDASMVYGSSEHLAQSLRDLTTDLGLLRVQPRADVSSGLDLLPFQEEEDKPCNQDPAGGDSVPCFLAGDSRANEDNRAIASHTVWVREHNRLARVLHGLNPHWGGDRLYQEAREIVAAEIQHITFSEYLPKILGPTEMEEVGEYSEYDPDVDPSVRNSVAMAAFRLNDAATDPLVQRYDQNYEEDPAIGNVALRDTFFAPWRIVKESGIDSLVRGLIGSPAKLATPRNVIHEELTEHMFALPGHAGLDIAAITIQRGRDHGIPFYNNWRDICELLLAESFDDLSGDIPDDDIRQKLADVYGDVRNVDLWPGGLLEDHVTGGRVGPTFRCLLAAQFKAIRQGDRFWHENYGVFTAAQRAQIGRVTYARVLCDNTGVTRLQPDVFVRTDVTDMVSCDNIPGVLMEVWKETFEDSDECHNPDMNDCEQICINLVGSYLCACQDGLVLRADGRSCASCQELYPDLVSTGDFGVYDNQCFWFSPLRGDRLTYPDAQESCVLLGGKLAMIKTAGVQGFIEDFLRTNRPLDEAKYFIGLDDLLTDYFAWSDGTELGDFTNWITEHTPYYRGNYGVLLEDQQWDLTRGSVTLPYICQMDPAD